MSFNSLQQEVGVFDAHADLLYTIVRERSVGNERVIEEKFLSDMQASGIDMRVAPIYLDADQSREPATRLGLRMAESFHKEVEQTDELESVETASEVRTCTNSDSISLILGMEGAEPLKGDIAVLDAFYRLGLRVLGLTHSRRNMAGDGAFFQPTRSGDLGGLSAFGVEAVERCVDRGIVLDVSHLNEPGFWDVIDFSDGPIIASHSNCRELRDHPRNLWDEQLQAIADTGGVVGINAIKEFLHGPDPDIESYIDHIEHVIDVVGAEHVGIGFDFYDYNLDYMSPAERAYMIDVSAADGLSEDKDVKNLSPTLIDREFNPETIRKILKHNFVRVFEEVLD